MSAIYGGGGGGGFTAGQDLSGSSTSQTVVGVQDRPVASTAPANTSTVYVWNGSQWAPRQITNDDLGASFSISLAAASGGSGALEVGATWTPTFNATYSPNSTGLSAATLNDTNSGSVNVFNVSNPLNPPTSSYTSSSVDASVSLSITATRSGVTKTSNSVGVTWEPKCWNGVGTAGASGLNGTTGVLAGATGTLSGQLQSSRATSFSVSPSSQKVYFACPASFGAATFKDQNGFAFAMNAPTVITVVNSHSVSLSYDLYESTNLLSTAYTVTVS